MKATIKDVAQRAGVSTATVSHVVNKTRFVSEATQKRVERAIQELSYRPNFRARNFKTGHSNAIGIIVPDIANLFFATVIEEIESIVSRFNYTLMIANTKENKNREKNVLQYFSNSLVDGILLASTFENYHELAPFLPHDIPLVLFDRKLEGAPYDTITLTSASIVRALLQQFVAEGHQKIGCIVSLPRLSTTQEHLFVYRDVLEKQGLYHQGKYVHCASHISDTGYFEAQELLKQGCTALLVLSNIMTRGVLQYLLDNNLTPEKDIPIAGYFNADFLAIHMRSIILPERNLGYQAGQLILSRIKHPDAPIQKIELSHISHPENNI